MTIELGSNAEAFGAGTARPEREVMSETNPIGALTAGRLLTLKEAAKLLGFTSHRTLENLRLRGLDPASIKLPCGGVRYTEAALEDWLRQDESVRARALSWRSHHEAKRKEERKARDRARYLARKEAERGGSTL